MQGWEESSARELSTSYKAKVGRSLDIPLDMNGYDDIQKKNLETDLSFVVLVKCP